MTTLRVCIAILFSTVALWAQSQTQSLCEKFQLEDRGCARAIQSEGSAQPRSTTHFILNSDVALQPEPSEVKERWLLAQSAPAPVFAMLPPDGKASGQKSMSLGSGYMTRRKIHKYVSYATLPLFAGMAITGEKLLDDSHPSSGLRNVHTTLAATTGMFMGVETVTGVWNMWKTRNMHNTRRMVHGVLMLAADAGFVATAATAPHREDNGLENGNGASTHRAIAYTSLGVATVGYLYMLLTK